MSVIDPLGLARCASCQNAFVYDRLDDGTCRHCGGSFDGGELDEDTDEE